MDLPFHGPCSCKAARPFLLVVGGFPDGADATGFDEAVQILGADSDASNAKPDHGNGFAEDQVLKVPNAESRHSRRFAFGEEKFRFISLRSCS